MVKGWSSQRQMEAVAAGVIHGHFIMLSSLCINHIAELPLKSEKVTIKVLGGKINF
jgi:hypothetical protein